MAEAASTPRVGVLLAPALAYGASGEHEGFPGTISIGTEALTGLLVEYGRSACRWAGRVLIVNGHGGNLDACARPSRCCAPRAGTSPGTRAASPAADAHAGRTETSLMLHVEPESVRGDRPCRRDRRRSPTLLPRLRAEGVRGVSPNGVLGDPAGATAEEGAALLERLAAGLVRAVDAWRVDATGASRTTI